MYEKAAKAKILLIPDVPNWIFDRHAKTLQNLLGDEFDFAVKYRGEPFDESEYDLIYPFEFNMVRFDQIKQPKKYVTGIRSFVSWFDWDFKHFTGQLNCHYQKVHVVSRQLYELLSPFIPDLRYVTHGIDTEIFKPLPKNYSPAGKLVLGWAGNRNTFVKGYLDYLHPLIQIPGVELATFGIANQRNLELDEMPKFYQLIDAYISTSSYEGNNNSLLEAASTGTAVITTNNGTVSEYLVDGKSALIVERNIEDIRNAVIELRDSQELRRQLGINAHKAVIQGGWDWKSRAEGYRQFFADSLEDAKSGKRSQQVAVPVAIDWLRVIQAQNDLLREARNYLLVSTGGKDVLKSIDEKTERIIELEAYVKQLETNAKHLKEENKGLLSANLKNRTINFLKKVRRLTRKIFDDQN